MKVQNPVVFCAALLCPLGAQQPAALGLRLVHPAKVTALAFAPSGSELYTAAADGKVRVFVSETGRRRAELQAHSGRINALALTADGNLIATAGADGRVAIHRRRQKAKDEFALLSELRLAAVTLSFTADGQRLHAATKDGLLVTMNVANGTELVRRPAKDKRDKRGVRLLDGLLVLILHDG